MADLRVHGLGAVVTLRPQTRAAEALLPMLEHAWSRCLDGSEDDVVAGEVLVTEPGNGSSDATLQHITQQVTRALIEAVAGRLFLFHAAALCHPETGRTVMAVAPGGTGKTTFAATLGQRFGYVSDETVGILDDGRLVPYQKPLSLRQAEGPKRETSPDDLFLLRPVDGARLSGVLLLRRDAQIGGMIDVVELSLLDAMAAMAPESSSLSAMAHPLGRLRDVLAPVEPVLQVTYAEAAQLSELVAELAGPA